MKRPKEQRMGKPFCHMQLMYIIQENGGTIKRVDLREKLSEQGYSKYCIYEAFRRCEWKEYISFEGSGNSMNQKVMLTEKFHTEIE